jgi:hypothetical protein
MTNILPVSINDGDPVTADILQKIIQNVATVAKGESATGVTIVNATTGAGNPADAPKELSTTVGNSIAVTLDAKKPSPFSINISGVKWAAAPIVTVSLAFNTSAPLDYKYIAVIQSITTTDVKGWVIPVGAVKTGKGSLKWIASGNLSA